MIETCENCKNLKAQLDGVCALLAEMRAAAMGEVIGPKRGPVEDVADLKSERDKLQAANAKLRAIADKLRMADGKLAIFEAEELWFWSDENNRVVMGDLVCEHNSIIVVFNGIPERLFERAEYDEAPLSRCYSTAALLFHPKAAKEARDE